MDDPAPDATGARAAPHRRIDRFSDGERRLRARPLRCHRRADGPLGLAAVARRAVAAAGGNDPEAVPSDDVQRGPLALVRRAVPALERDGLVAYSRADGTLGLIGPGTP